MQANDNPFPRSGNNFRTVAYAETDLELSLLVLELGFPVREDDSYTYDDLAADYAVAMAEFKRQMAAGECTDTVVDTRGNLPASLIANS
jgi:hypothetical protein